MNDLKYCKYNFSKDKELLKGKCDKCGEEFVLSLDNKYISCTKAEFYATQEANRQLNKDISELQSEVEKYRKAFEDAKKERDCQIAEYQKKIEELNVENAELHCEMQAMKVFPDEIPEEPIKAAEMLITAKGECEPLHIGNDVFKDTYRIFGVSELRQIAEHLLVYCNHNGEAEE